MLFQPYHDAEDEPTAEPLDTTFFDFDTGDPLSKEELKGRFNLQAWTHTNYLSWN